MSNVAINWAIARKIRGLAKPVLFVLANRADDSGKCFPSIATICDDVGFAERAVREALRQLEREGLILSHHKKGQPTHYELNTTGATATPASSAPRREMPDSTPAPSAANPGISCHQPRHLVPPTPAPSATITQSNPNITQTNPQQARERARARGSRLDPGWLPSPSAIAFAENLSLDPAETLAEFRDYWLALSGAKATKLDWDATFRNNCRMLAKRRKPVKAWSNGFLDLAVNGAAKKNPPVIDDPVSIALGISHVRH